MSTAWIPGVVSVTFRDKSPEDVIRLAKANGLEAVEWSENAHIQPDDPEGAARIRRLTEEAGLKIAAYGSYYRVGEYGDQAEETFRRSLVSACALGADVIRVWAGVKASADADPEDRLRVARDAHMIASMAAEKGVRIAFEWHKNTLTDTNESAMQLLKDANHPNLYCLWQPTVALTPAQRVEGVQLLGDRLVNYHVYSWPDGKRGPLNAAEWKLYLDAAQCGGSHYALMEFVRDNTEEQFASDAKTLNDLIRNGGYYG
ncbi:MAG: sugar phosphate isomerase/epimerase [Clostridia bacterium]|nr:sugar phosphate isomerase/epimerase [Clostridia bacterium]